MEPNREKISDLELRHGRDINLLIDEKRVNVINSLSQLTKLLSNIEFSPSERIYFFQNYILKNYLLTFDSQFDSVRENSLKLITVLNSISTINPSIKLNTEAQCSILSKLLSKIIILPFKEPSEEIRLQITRILTDMIFAFDDAFFRLIGDVIQGISSLLQDKFPEVKKQTSLFLEKLISKFGDQIGMNSKKILTQICNNCFHTHSKIRKLSIEVLEKVIVLPKVGENVKNSIEIVSVLGNDKNPEIREEVYRCFNACLQKLSFEVLKDNEIFLISEMMSGCEDESEVIRRFCEESLKLFADRRKEFFIKFNS